MLVVIFFSGLFYSDPTVLSVAIYLLVAALFEVESHLEDKLSGVSYKEAS
jgi:hypothetical protein